MRITPNMYIYPPRTKLTTPFNHPTIQMLKTDGWEGQFKVNDSHIILWYNAGEMKLWSRHADLIKGYPLTPEMRGQITEIITRLGLDPAGHHRFDGGLLHTKHTAIRNTIALWDILVVDGEYLTNTTYESRFARLQAISRPEGQRVFTGGDYALRVGTNLTDDVFIPIWLEDWERAWEGLVRLNKAYEQPLIEGIVMKDPAGMLTATFSENNKCAWMAKSRVETRRHLF